MRERESSGEKLQGFPDFMRRQENAVDAGSAGAGMTGYAFDGADGSQMVIWQCEAGGTSAVHAHDYDEYAVVLQGAFTATVGGTPIVLGPGDECFIPAGVPHGGAYSANYRAIDAFGGQRVKRVRNSDDEKQQQ